MDHTTLMLLQSLSVSLSLLMLLPSLSVSLSLLMLPQSLSAAPTLPQLLLSDLRAMLRLPLLSDLPVIK